MRRGIKILIWTVVAVTGLGFLGVSGVGLWFYINHDRPELIDDEVLSDAIETACATMTGEVRAAAVPHGSPVAVRVAAIRRQDQAVWDFAEAVLAVGPERLDRDLPARRWLQDWESIMILRERAAADLALSGKATFAVPAIDGYPITQRMNDASGCQVPGELTTLP